MATTITNINEALVDERVVGALRHVLPILKKFSYVIEMDDRIVDDTVYVPLATDPAKATKTPGTLLTAAGTLAGTLVTLDTFEGAAWDATEGTMRGSLFPQYWADKAAGATYSTAKSVIDTLLALVTAANFGNVEATDKLTVAPADFGQDDMALAWQYGTAKIKRQEKVLLLNTVLASKVFGNSAMSILYATAGNDFVKSGVLPAFIGMDTVHYGDMPANAEELTGAVLGRAALAVAIAKPSQLMAAGEGNIVERRVITEPDSGLSVMLTTKADAGGTLTGEVALLYGVAKGQNSAVRIVSA